MDWTPSLLHIEQLAWLTMMLLCFWTDTFNKQSVSHVQPVHTKKQFKLCGTLWFVESQLSAHHTCINNVPEVITDAAISIVVADLYSALPHWWLRTIHQSDATICACCEIYTKHPLKIIWCKAISKLTLCTKLCKQNSLQVVTFPGMKPGKQGPQV